MYLLDTNIWLERLLGQEQSALVGELLDRLAPEMLLLTDFTLHSLGVILGRLNYQAVFPVFVHDVVLNSGVAVMTVPPFAIRQVVDAMHQWQLDFDDAYQYTAATMYHADLVSFDRHFDQTDRGRLTPQDVLIRLQSDT